MNGRISHPPIIEPQPPSARGRREAERREPDRPSSNGTAKGELAHAEVKKHARFSPIWLVPICAALLVAYLAITGLAKRGTVITITFKTADGMSVQQTRVKHKAVELGTVEDIRLSDDMSHVIVRVRMQREATSMLTDHARFWVVRPRLNSSSLAGLEAGLETLVSGAYIAIDPGAPGGHRAHAFTGLEEPPGVRSDQPGHTYVLHASTLGSVSTGSPVYYRNVGVGEVLGYDLGDGKGPATVRIFVHAPYDRFVHSDTRFWNASGLAVNVGAEGLRLEVESLQALLAGGVAFRTPSETEGAPSPDNATFDLYDNEAKAEAATYTRSIRCVSYFESSVQSLASGSPVQVLGVTLGSVTDVRLVPDVGDGRWRARVAFDLHPQRLLPREDGPALDDVEKTMRAVVESGAAHGLRVVLDSSNFLTGQKVLSLQMVPNAPPADLAREGDAVVLPSQSGGIDTIITSLSDLATKLDRIPIGHIGAQVDQALASLSSTLHDAGHLVRDVDRGAAPALERLPTIAQQLQEAVQRANGALGENGYGQNSGFQRDIERVLDQVNDAARSIRLLADFLDRHPESLIRGRTAQTGER